MKLKSLLLALLSGVAGRFSLANSAGTHGSRTFIADGAATERHLLYTQSSATEVSVCGLDDLPCGNSRDQAKDGEPIAIDLFRAAGGSRVGVAAGEIAFGVKVYTAAAGQISATGAEDSYQVGYSIGVAAASGDEIEYREFALDVAETA